MTGRTGARPSRARPPAGPPRSRWRQPAAGQAGTDADAGATLAGPMYIPDYIFLTMRAGRRGE